ncbi:DUF1918 domain-containing protein [Pseudonocardia sp. GCM10023141]|uniref:DUF1918 domain-containing protein n=1 Tax=Pseudonocardia sp. GCM10023141 TaxID=3252653 RepID=UPI003606F87C
MHARIGDWLVVEGNTPDEHRRQGEIVRLAHADGTPPYWVRWVEDEHESLVFPGPSARIESHPVAPSVGFRH